MVMQIDEGTFQGFQDNDPQAVFWIHRPQGSTQEFWITYKHGLPGGFTPPSAIHPSVKWSIQYVNVNLGTDPCDFVDWVVRTYNVSAEDLTTMQHDVTPVSCETEIS